jgi:hypothetical protein
VRQLFIDIRAELKPNRKEVHIFKCSWLANSNWKPGYKRKDFKKEWIDIISITHDIPFKTYIRTITRYDHGSWSSSDHTFESEIAEKKVIPEIEKLLINQALNIYKHVLQLPKLAI